MMPRTHDIWNTLILAAAVTFTRLQTKVRSCIAILLLLSKPQCVRLLVSRALGKEGGIPKRRRYRLSN